VFFFFFGGERPSERNRTRRSTSALGFFIHLRSARTGHDARVVRPVTSL